ncbi:aminoacyltransferase [Candidatus Saccharibacteria bacterium]|nr:aminoacyltransferase [Candidatus Saccharibacteria bacterium]
MITTYIIPKQWDNLVDSHHGHPLQLFGWGEVKKVTGSWQVTRLANDNYFAQILIRKTPLGRFGYIPRGNNFDSDFLRELKAFAQKENLFMLRFEPNVKATDWHHKLKKARDHVLLARTIQLDLTKSKEELLATMDSKTRQYIRRSERDNNTTIRKARESDLDRILTIYRETAKRAGFPIHPDSYYRTIFKQMGQNNHIHVAEINGQVEAFLWCVKTPEVCIELYGGATDLAFQKRANYTLKWHTILTAKGICLETVKAAPDSKPVPSRSYDVNGLLNDGISKFKLGFSGGAEIQLAATSDLVIKPLNYFFFATLLPLFKRLSSRRT